MVIRKPENYRPIAIGVDHGYGNIKTAHRAFRTGVIESESKPIVSNNYLYYEGKYYVIGENHITYQGQKTDSQDFYILTLAALGEELLHRGFCNANVNLAVGLPLAWVSSQKERFKNYLLEKSDVEFSYKDKKFRIHFNDCSVYPQGYSAVMSYPLDGDNIVADIGNGTMNTMRIYGNLPREDSLRTEKYGVDICVKKICAELSKESGNDFPEEVIEMMIRNGIGTPKNIAERKTKEIASSYAREIRAKLLSYGFIPGLNRLYITGGGSCIMKNFSQICEEEGVVLIEDIMANAKGYETLEQSRLDMAMKKEAANG